VAATLLDPLDQTQEFQSLADFQTGRREFIDPHEIIDGDMICLAILSRTSPFFTLTSRWKSRLLLACRQRQERSP